MGVGVNPRSVFGDSVYKCLIGHARPALGGPFLLGYTTVVGPMKSGSILMDG